jgi:hypothetical protein
MLTTIRHFPSVATEFVLWPNSERFNLENDDSRNDPQPSQLIGRTRR